MNSDSFETLRRHLDVMAQADRGRRVDNPGPGQVVTLSRAGGSGGDSIARRVATSLGLPLFDREILDAVAEESGWDRELLARLDESVEPYRGAWLRTILSGNNVYPGSYRRNLVNAILGISLRGGVILGRGANLILADRPVLRVRICGSPSVRRDRLARTAGCTADDAAVRIAEFDRTREQFIHTLFDRDIDDPTTYDLVLNTDRIAEDLAARLVIATARDR